MPGRRGFGMRRQFAIRSARLGIARVHFQCICSCVMPSLRQNTDLPASSEPRPLVGGEPLQCVAAERHGCETPPHQEPTQQTNRCADTAGSGMAGNPQSSRQLKSACSTELLHYYSRLVCSRISSGAADRPCAWSVLSVCGQSPGDQVNDGREEEIARVPGCSSSECWSKSGILIHRDPVLMLLPISMGMDHL